MPNAEEQEKKTIDFSPIDIQLRNNKQHAGDDEG